jgi:hypothetical protein
MNWKKRLKHWQKESEARMKIREFRIRDRGWKARSIVECGSPLPLFVRRTMDWYQCQSARGLAQSKTWRTIVAAIAVSALALVSTSAQSYSINWYKIAGGGGTSTNGQYSLSGTIGQPDASGAMTGGNYSLTGGFWALVSVVQTPGAPTLYISHSGNTVTVYWQNVSGWVLQQTSSINPPVGWTQYGTSPTLSNGTNYIYITPPIGNEFFRLGQ